MEAGTRTGRCNCGAVSFSTRGELRGVVYCHCSQCRRQTGLYYAATNVAHDAIEIEGEQAITWYEASPSAQRGFCRICGSALFWKRHDSDQISVLAGAFDQPSGLVGAMHIFTEAKADFYEIEDDLPQHSKSTPSVPVADEA